MNDTNMTCPTCGGNLKTKKTLRFSVSDLLGVIVVGIFLAAALALAAYALGPWGTGFAIVIIVLAGLIVRSGGWKELGKPTLQSGVFTPGWIIGGLLFILWALGRFFFWFEIRSSQVCSQCGYKKYDPE
ncbi:MAG: hypothetical protein KJ958_13190 [Gammaproteobacteria bacterium]|nr:hypothetical protein [Gammaproteobacteria bacterium]MBU1980113.1 hypothetical protein [Gammaproteobacteria bacterium]